MTKNERDKIIASLDEHGIDYDLLSHKHIHTSEEAAETRGHDLNETIKSLVLTVDDDAVLYAVPGDRLVDFDCVADALGADTATLADPSVVEEVTGCEVGSVPPFGPCLGVQSYVDEAALGLDEVYASIGTHTDSVRVNTAVFDELGFDVLSCTYKKD